MREAQYQPKLIERLYKRFNGCVIIQNDPKRIQGVCDLLVLWQDRWAMLEVKRSAHETPRPNQPYYVDAFNKMSFAAFIYPENEAEVLDALQSAFGA
jgi:hypothetical protein